jgi:site-specific DNA-methyltransferase (cytosine-N4-specific)
VKPADPPATAPARPQADRSTPTTAGGAEVFLYHREAGVTLYLGDALAVLAALPSASVDCVVTSPPYWRLRSYAADPGDDRPYGLEPTATAYVDRLRAVFAELRRILAPTGTAWLNLGDSYSTNSDGYRCANPGLPRQPRLRPAAGVAHKNLLGMPWRVAFALQADGWILRNAIVWYKPNAAPTPAADRLACRHELLFLLTARPRYHFDLDAIRQPYTGDRPISRRTHRGGVTPRAACTPRSGWPPPGAAGRGRNPGDVWTIPARPASPGCPPAFPVELPLRCIAAGCPPGGVVLDPFSGAGTTGLAARRLGRGYVGVDLNPACHEQFKTALSHLMHHAAAPDDGGTSATSMSTPPPAGTSGGAG